MAIEACRECGEDVSTGAETCPSCGLQYPTPRSGERAMAIGFWAIVAGVVAYLWLTGVIG